MSKYSFELKKRIVGAYLRGEGGYGYLAKKYGVNNRHQVEIWVRNYKKLGDDGLRCSRKTEQYSFEFKLNVVESYLSSELSYRELALSFGIKNDSLIYKWVNAFRIAGSDALRPRKRGRKKTLDKSKEKSSSVPEDNSINTSAEHVKELEEELLKLRIENAFLKELRRLRLEDEAKMRERRESSTASEDNSN
jgi:transposase